MGLEARIDPAVLIPPVHDFDVRSERFGIAAEDDLAFLVAVPLHPAAAKARNEVARVDEAGLIERHTVAALGVAEVFDGDLEDIEHPLPIGDGHGPLPFIGFPWCRS